MKIILNKKDDSSEKFSPFIFRKLQLIDWLIIVGICTFVYVVLRAVYPYPATMQDSGGYVFSAMNDFFYFYRPFGYSQFLRIVHSFSSSIHAVFTVQMILYGLSIGFFSLTIKYFFRPQNQIIWYILLIILVFSPMSFFMANAIMSDMLFAIMIFGLLTAFAFVVMKKSWWAFACFVLLMFFALHIRYSAIIFPFLFIPVLLFVKSPIRWAALVVLPLTFAVFHNQVKADMKETTGFNQFSTGFDGWQLANNALHIVPFTDLPPNKIRKAKIRNLHEFVLNYNQQILEATDHGKRVTAFQIRILRYVVPLENIIPAQVAISGHHAQRRRIKDLRGIRKIIAPHKFERIMHNQILAVILISARTQHNPKIGVVSLLFIH